MEELSSETGKADLPLDNEMVLAWRMAEGCSSLSGYRYFFYLERSVFAVCYHVVERDDQGVDMEMRKGVNESRDESEEEQEGGYGNEEAEEVSTLEGMGYVLDDLEYEVDVTVYLERIGLDSRRFSDHR